MLETPHFDVSKQMLKEIAQTMLEVKKMARSIENAATSLLPLTSNDEVVALLDTLSFEGQRAAEAAQQLYRMIAREAMAE